MKFTEATLHDRSLGTGQTQIVTFTRTNAPPGTYQAWCYIDSFGNSVVESNEANNVAGPIAVTVGVGLANDNFANRISIVAPNPTVSGNNVNANKEPNEPNHANSSGGKSVWWTWTPSANGIVTVDTIGSSFDTLLAIYTGTAVNNLTPVAADDDGGGSLTSRTNFNAIAGMAYQIAVDGFGGASGNILLHVAFVPAGSLPTFTGVGGGPLAPPSNGQFQIEVHATQAQVIVQASTNLMQWTDVTTLNMVNGKAVFVDGNAGAHSNRFYRLKP